MSKTTLDLSALSDITDGTHTVKVKAKADGYRDSEFSNEVSYTKAPAGYTVTFGGTSVSTSDLGNVTVTIPNDGTFHLTNSTIVKNNVSLFTLGGATAVDMRVAVEMGGTSTQYEVFENIDINVTGNATVYLKNKYE